MKEFEPKIVAFCCNYCAYAAADLSGSMRIQYPTNVRIIKTPCTGRLEVQLLMRAFERGADGVLVAGCLEGGCHFIEGNLFAKKRVNYTRDLLAELGLERERLRMVNVSASMGRPFTEEVSDMVDTVRELGPSPLALRKADCGLQIEREGRIPNNPKSEIQNPKLENHI